jgi:AcrR family transcriptional regulator
MSPKPVHPKPDRRVARTQHSLHVALNTLILEKGYDAITIQDITDRANVGRSTFYAHHGSKEGLLLSGLQHLRMLLLAHQREARAAADGTQERVLGFSRAFFEHVHEYRDVYLAVAGNRGGPAVNGGIKRIVADVVRIEFGSIKGADRDKEVPRDAAIQFTVDTLFSILLWWCERSPKLSPAEADAIFRRLTLPALAAVGIR